MLNFPVLSLAPFRPIAGFVDPNWNQSTVVGSFRTVSSVILLLIDWDIPHNLFMCRSSQFCDDAYDHFVDVRLVTVFAFPKKAAVGQQPQPLDDLFSASAHEAAGQLLVCNKSCFDTITEEDVIEGFKSTELAVYSPQEFDELCNRVRSVLV